MAEFFQHLIEILTLPPIVLHQATVSLNSFEFDDTILFDYLGYLHYGMGTPLYLLFSSITLIGIGAAIWSFIVKAFAWIMDIIPFA